MTTDWHETSAGGQTFRYLDSGDGPLVLLFHGFPDLPNGWDRVRERLNDAGFRTVAPYLRGYHPATLSGRGFGVAEAAADVVLLLDALGEESAAIVGHDWGASVVYGAATASPQRVTGVVAIAVPHPGALRPSLGAAVAGRHFLWFKLPWAETTARLFGLRMVDRLYRRWAPGWKGPERDAAVQGARKAFRDRRVLAGSLAWYKALKPGEKLWRTKITVPALVVGGAMEPAVFQQAYRASAKRFTAGCDVLLLEGAGHWPHREAEPEFLDALVGFLTREA